MCCDSWTNPSFERERRRRVQGHGWKSVHWNDDSIFGTVTATMGALYTLSLSKGNDGGEAREHVTRRVVCAGLD